MPMGVTGRFLAAAALGVGAVIAAPAACLFPSYTFDLTASSSSGSGGAGSSTSATTTSTSTTTTSTTGTGGTGGAPVMEDCLNGVDDNGDGKVDCADPECQVDYECVDPLPTGWGTNGYVALYEGATGQTPPACPDGLPNAVPAGNATLDWVPASCVACGCGAPTGQDCQLLGDLNPAMGLQPMQVSNMGCGLSATQLTALTVPDPPWGGACYHDEMLPGGQLCSGQPCNTSVQSTPPTVTGGTCQPTGGVPASKPTPTWVTTAVACQGSAQGKGCAGQQVCVPRPKNPFKAHVCVEQPGDVACPVGSAFSNKNVYYGDYTDTRDCTGCNCGGASGGSCEITISLYSDQANGTCTTQVTSFKAGQCGTIGGNQAIYGWTDQITKAPQGGSCAPITTTMTTGQVTTKSPTTFCCL